MAFPPSRSRTASAPRPPRVVLAVGQRAFIHRPGDGTRPVALTDANGLPAPTLVSDGDEVEILGWRPRGSSGTRYRVRRYACGADGWLAAEELRATAARPAAPTPPAPELPAASGLSGAGRPFGSRL